MCVCVSGACMRVCVSKDKKKKLLKEIAREVTGLIGLEVSQRKKPTYCETLLHLLSSSMIFVHNYTHESQPSVHVSAERRQTDNARKREAGMVEEKCVTLEQERAEARSAREPERKRHGGSERGEAGDPQC